ncbi:MAG TPA: cupin domain-containing protein [Nannocystaceae bacterium]|nr:cupin domain-containing protein [Nannocystaceae bacterium]
MQIRADRSIAARVVLDELEWIASPAGGVERKPLERDGEEIARATSVVRYAPNSRFPRHVHERGEEFLVLEGEFCDEHGRYGPGTYVRNPPGSSHAPFSDVGCIIFVKLRQFVDDDLRAGVLAPEQLVWRELAPGHTRALLHEHRGEHVALDRIAPGRRAALGPCELLLVEGELVIDDARIVGWTWCRWPDAGHVLQSPDGALVWLKWGHLA